jgi:predicted nucleic acid-binding protein
MAASALVDAGFLVALLSRRDANHRWAAAQAPRFPPPWTTCEAVLSEASHLLGGRGTGSLILLLRRGAVICRYRFADDMEAVLKLLEKYSDVPMSFADACLVRMTETLNDPMLLTTDADFRIYRRHGRQVIPCTLPH